MAGKTGAWGSHRIKVIHELEDGSCLSAVSDPKDVYRRRDGSFFIYAGRRRQTVQRGSNGTFSVRYKPFAFHTSA